MSMVTGRPLVKGYIGRIRNGALESLMDFQFNPTEVPRARTVDYTFSQPPGSPLPTAMFRGIQGDSFSLSLLFDAVETYDHSHLGTTAQKAFLESLTQPDLNEFSDDIGQFVPPPHARYGMGDESWEVVVTSLQFRDVRWNRSGIPTRTWADVQMRTVFVDIASLRARLDFLAQYRDLAAV